jgi:tetratricopeptide (TPR) repeat protein
MQALLFAAKGDIPRAMLRARQILTLNPNNPVAIRVVADIADSINSPYALQWRQRLLNLNPDFTNRLALAKSALRSESFPFPTATKTLNEIAPSDQKTIAFQMAAGSLALKLNHLTEAEQHYAAALKANPKDPVSRMSLAVVRLQSGNPNLISDSRTTLELLGTDRQIGLLAKRSLVAESIARQELRRAEVISKQIYTNQQATFSDRIIHLAILNAAESQQFRVFLDETKKRAEEAPNYIGETVAWMNRNGFSQESLNWLNSLSPQLTKHGLVRVAMADTYVALEDWTGLNSYLQKERWKGMDAVRLGLITFATWKESGKKPDQTAWHNAMQLAAQTPTTLNTLAEMSAEWDWQQETEDILWFTLRKYPSEKWAQTSLERLYITRQETTGLWRLYQMMAKTSPNDAQAKNNFLSISLLLGIDLENAHIAAQKLHASEPENAIFTSTYAFSVFLQGHPDKAVQLMRSVGLERLDDPSLAAYYAIFLVAAGDAPTARIYLAKASKAFLLPEEQNLMKRAKKSIE